jgi:hypothetical protein
MDRQILKTVLIFCMAILSLFSCKKGDQTYYNYKHDIPVFNGSALDYLKAQTGVYDSMLVAINRIPGLQDSLTHEKLTVFGVTNGSFQTVITALNLARAGQNKTPIYLKDIDTAVLDTMICKYLVRGTFTTAFVSTQSNGIGCQSIKLNYPMYLTYQLLNASGYLNGGEQQLTFYDTNYSAVSTDWIGAGVDSLNIKTSNAVIHVLSPGHNFDFNQFVTKLNK